MSTLALSAAVRTAALAAARPAVLQALIDLADAGAGPAQLEIYGTTRPATSGDAPGGAALATLVLTKPCGTVELAGILLTQASVIGDLIAANGAAVWGRLATS